MKPKTFGSLFSGGRFADVGAVNAGLKPIFAIEYRPDIADAADKNFNHRSLIEDVTEVNFKQLKSPDWLHVSPPCTTASQVNNKPESQADIDMAIAVCRAIDTLEPEYFSLENVRGYWNYDSFSLIVKTLKERGYNYDSEVLSADTFGVPQARKRLFLVASINEFNRQWCIPQNVVTTGWYEAIADLVPSLEKTTLNGWQKQRLCSLGYAETVPFSDDIILFDSCPNMAIERSGARRKDGIPRNQIVFPEKPIFTIKAMRGDVRPSVNQVTLLIDRQPYQADYRCLARWQSIPDSYRFSDNKKLNIEMIGNGVPPLMLQRIIESTLGN